MDGAVREEIQRRSLSEPKKVAGKQATKKPKGSLYYKPRDIAFVTSGCTLLDCAATMTPLQCWPIGRVVNIVGDKSTGKTQLAIEAMANFHKQFPKGFLKYREAEAAFDLDYAEVLGLPIKEVDFGKPGSWRTVEDVYEDLRELIHSKPKDPVLYIIDSLDSLSTRERKKRKVGQATYGTDKAKMMSDMFQDLVQDIQETNICLIVISQVRENIGVTFGRQYKRTGGKAMDFYASLVIYLAKVADITKTVSGQKRAIGVRIKAKVDKNKLAVPYRSCEFIIRFNYGIDDVESCVDWLQEIGVLRQELGIGEKEIGDYLHDYDEMDNAKRKEVHNRIREIVAYHWKRIEDEIKPKHRKYD